MKIKREAFSLSKTLPLRGLAALLVVLSHLGLPSPIKDVGYVCVAIFFFFSGFGLLQSIDAKPGYLKDFPKKRILSVALPYLSACVFYVGLISLLGYWLGWRVVIIGTFFPYIDAYRFISVGWYVCALLWFYAVFYAAFIRRMPVGSWLIMLLGWSAYYIWASLVKPEYWVMSMPAFCFGAILGATWKRDFELPKPVVALIGMVSGLVFLAAFVYRIDFKGHLGSIMICVLVVVGCQFFSVARLRWLDMLGKRSLELYLVHPLLIQVVNNDGIFLGPTRQRESCYWPYIFSFRVESKALQVLIVLGVSLIIASILGKLNQIVLDRLINKRLG